MKYLKKFETTSQYEAYTADTSNFILPNVSFCEDNDGVHYNPILSIENAIITCDSATYNGQTQVATNIVVTLNGETFISGTDYTVSNNEGGINAGNYTFTIDGIGNYSGSKNGTFIINKVTPTVTAPTAKTGLVYDGTSQRLVNAGSTNFGTLQYSLDDETYGTSVPSGTNAGDYTVYYKVVGDSNINDVAANTVSVRIDYPYVEIGGTKWATMNVGANSVTDTGLYFQWGDTQGYAASQVGSGEGQKYFSWEDYKYWTGDTGSGSSGITKYNSTDGKTVLDLSDDAVKANWGGSWRMPTTGNVRSLTNNTTTAWTDDYQGSGVAGMVFTDKTDSSKVLFFPAAGFCSKGMVYNVGSGSGNWANSLYVSNVQRADYLSFNRNVSYLNDAIRVSGFSVRGVLG